MGVNLNSEKVDAGTDFEETIIFRVISRSL